MINGNIYDALLCVYIWRLDQIKDGAQVACAAPRNSVYGRSGGRSPEEGPSQGLAGAAGLAEACGQGPAAPAGPRRSSLAAGAPMGPSMEGPVQILHIQVPGVPPRCHGGHGLVGCPDLLQRLLPCGVLKVRLMISAL